MIKRKLMALSQDLELAILAGMLKRTVPLDAVEPEEVSKLGRGVLGALRALDKPTSADILLHAVEVQGAGKDQLAAYLRAVELAGAGVEATEILRKVRDKQVLVDLINEAGEQLHKGTLDLGLLTGLFSKEAGASIDLQSIAEVVKDGLPPKPQGLPLASLRLLTEASGGILGMWVVGGEPGVGKSTLAWQIALDAATRMPVLVYDFENGFPVMMDHTREIYNGDLGSIRAATERVYYRDSIRGLDADLARVPAPALIVVDSIQKLPGSVEFRRSSLDRWIHRLEYLKKRGYSLLVVSEIGRASYGHDAYIGAYKETGEIEYSADFALQLLDGSGGQVEAHIVKNRHRPKRGLAVMLQRKRAWLFNEVELNYDGSLPTQVIN